MARLALHAAIAAAVAAGLAAARVPPLLAQPQAAAAGEILVVLPDGRGSRRTAAVELGGTEYIAASDVAEILRATSYWRSETRKLLLRIGGHRVTLTVDNPFVLIDQRTLRLPARPVLRDGQVWGPIALFDLLAAAGLTPEPLWNPGQRELALGPAAPGAGIGTLTFEDGEGATTLTVPVEEAVTPAVLAAAPDSFVVRLRGASAGPEMLGPHAAAGRFASVVLAPAPGGVDLVLAASESSGGYLVRRLASPPRVEILVADEAGPHGELVVRAFLPRGAREERLGPSGLAPDALAAAARRGGLVVLDPGHGGEDPGTRSPGGRLEKHLTLELAERLRRHLERRAGLRVLLVRERDERVDVPRRVEIANGARGDLFLSLHLDLGAAPGAGRFRIAVRAGGGPGGGASGSLEPGERAAAGGELGAFAALGVETLSLAGWESAGAAHAVESQALAQNIADQLQARFADTPAGVEHRPVWGLEGADMPAVLIELVAPGEGDADEAMASGATLEGLAAAIADGVAAARADDSRGTSPGAEGRASW